MKTTNKTAKLLVHGALIYCMIGLGALEAYAQKSGRAGTAGASELLVPLTARNSALANVSTSGMTNMNGLEALYSNPAALTVNDGTSALFSRMEYVADIGVNYFGIGQSVGNNDIAFTIASWDFGNIPKQTELSPEITNVTFDATYFTAAFSYARQLTDRIAAGATVKAISESIDDVSATAIAFDGGMTYVVGETGLRLGVALKNMGNELQFDGTGLIRQVKLPGQEGDASNNALALESEGVQLPSLLNFGVAYTRGLGAQGSVTLLGNFRSNSFQQDQFSGAVELGFQELVYVRGGYQLQEDSDLTFYQGVTFGAGLNLEFGTNRVSFDYAFVPTDFFDDVNYFTVGVTL